MFYRNMFTPVGWGWPNVFGFFIPFFIGLVVIELILKGLALWRAARNSQNVWFIVLLIINSAGILPAIYLLFFQKKTAKVGKK